MVDKRNTSHSDNIHTPQHLTRLGWTSHFQTQRQGQGNDEVLPARVIGVSKNTFRVSNGEKDWLASVAGRLKHQSDGVYPVTGDWVLTANTVIMKVLNRKNALSRGASGTHGKQDSQPRREQVIAANLDTVFVVSGLDRDYNLRRIERYLTLIYNCGLKPVIILTKADLHRNPDQCVAEVEKVAFGVPVHLVSALDRKGISSLEHYLTPGLTTSMVGSSGAGKSTLVNRLYGRTVQATGSISAHIGKGTHTTTTRDLIMMPQGGMVIDNPGIREIAFWSDDNGIDAAFPEIENYSRECRFANCSHTHEPGCRVLLAVADGDMVPDRLESYQKMKRELTYLSKRSQKSADRVEKEQWRDVALKIKAMKKV